MADNKEPRIKCRWCDWSTRSRTIGKTKEEDPVGWSTRMKAHIEDAHPEQFDKLYPLDEEEDEE